MGVVLKYLNVNRSIYRLSGIQDGAGTMNKREWWWLAGVSLLLAIAGTVPDVDQISHWVLSFVESLPPDGFLRSYELPPPANGEHGFRPLSVFLLKAYLLMFSADKLIPMAAVFVKIFTCAFILGHASFLWLKERLGVKWPLLAAIAVVVSSPHLFGLWVLAELDGLGAACILHATRLWWREESSVKHTVVLWSFMGCAMLLKESSALMMLSSLFALGVWHIQRGLSPRRALRDFFVLAVIWVVWAWELIGGGRASNVGEAPWSMRLPIIFFTAWQYLYLVSVPGVLLLLSGIIDSKWRSKILWMTSGLIFVMPPMVWINHYESIYFSPWWCAGLLTVVLYGSLLHLALQRKRGPSSEAAWIVLGAQGIMWAAILISSAPREDMASRIFLPATAPLIGLMCLSIEKHVDFYTHLGFRILTGALISFFGINALNTLIERQAGARLHHNAVFELSEQSLGPKDKILFNNFAYRLSPEPLQILRNKPTPQIVYISDYITDPHFPSIIWGDLLELELRYSQGERFWFFWTARRLVSDGGEGLEGQFSYTRRPMGAFQPLHKTPNDFLPEHNYVEDVRKTTYSSNTTPLQELLAQRGDRIWAARYRYFLIPAQVYEIPQRLIRNMPVIEWYSYDADIWTVQK